MRGRSVPAAPRSLLGVGRCHVRPAGSGGGPAPPHGPLRSSAASRKAPFQPPARPRGSGGAAPHPNTAQLRSRSRPPGRYSQVPWLTAPQGARCWGQPGGDPNRRRRPLCCGAGGSLRSVFNARRPGPGAGHRWGCHRWVVTCGAVTGGAVAWRL